MSFLQLILTPHFLNHNRAIIGSNSQALNVIEAVQVPAFIEQAGPDFKRRFVEFFTANLANHGTANTYARAISQFCCWCEQQGIAVESIEPALVAHYIRNLQTKFRPATVKVHLAAIRMLFDYLVTGGLLRINPAASVRGPKWAPSKGLTPVLSASDCRCLFDSIDTSKPAGLRDRALIGLLVFAWGRVSAVCRMQVHDLYQNGHRWWVRFVDKGKQAAHHAFTTQR